MTYEQIDKAIYIIEQSIKSLLNNEIPDSALSVINGW